MNSYVKQTTFPANTWPAYSKSTSCTTRNCTSSATEWVPSKHNYRCTVNNVGERKLTLLLRRDVNGVEDFDISTHAAPPSTHTVDLTLNPGLKIRGGGEERERESPTLGLFSFFCLFVIVCLFFTFSSPPRCLFEMLKRWSFTWHSGQKATKVMFGKRLNRPAGFTTWVNHDFSTV